MKKISVLGATGSVGTQTLDVVRQSRGELQILALAAYSNAEAMMRCIQEFRPQMVCMYQEEAAKKLREDLLTWDEKEKPIVTSGMEGLLEVATWSESEILVTALVGMVGLKPSLAAIDAGKTIALANKETLVTGGHLVMRAAKEKGLTILPVDSEHSAIFQCLQGQKSGFLHQIILTASGGPFRGKKSADLEKVTAAQALRHPTWSMGRKISIDSATLMNKGLEVIEASYLFDARKDQIQVVVHPQSIIHSMVEFSDGSLLAQMGTADMRLPIQYALWYPERGEVMGKRLNLHEMGNLTFEKPDLESFPCLKMAYECMENPKSSFVVLNGANEVLVHAFLEGRIGFNDIPRRIAKALEAHSPIEEPNLEEILALDQWARGFSLQKKF